MFATEQAMNISRNNEVHLYNHCHSRSGITII